jgi:hypothetical protein
VRLREGGTGETVNELLEQSALLFVEAVCSYDFVRAERWLQVAFSAAAESREALLPLLSDQTREEAL